MIAPVAVAAGNTMVKSPFVLVLSPPKSITQTAGSPEALSLYIIKALAVMVLLENVKSRKSTIAVVEDDVGGTCVRAEPPEL